MVSSALPKKHHPKTRWLRWADSDAYPASIPAAPPRLTKQMTLKGWLPFVFLHVGCLGAFLTGVSPVAIGVAITLYWLRMFAITAFYHRYFSHRTFKTSRGMQFVFALAGLTAVQRGPLWWAANHRIHHRVSDTQEDLHSPVQRGFWWSQIGWITNPENLTTRYEQIKDFGRFPELVFLNRFDMVGPALLFALLLVVGSLLHHLAPALNTSGPQLVVWGFFISTIMVFHATSTINSLAHQWGSRRYATPDQSRNNLWLALLTMGEGWHNNHHHYQSTVRQGFFWWEIDVTYYLLWLMSKLGLVWDLKPLPVKLMQSTP